MIQPEFKNIVFHFARDGAREGVASIFLFGSVAKQTADNRSDIDMLVVLDTYSKEFTRLEVTNIISELALHLEKEYDRSVQVIFTNKVFDDLDENFIRHVLQEGIILYAKPPEIKVKNFDLKPFGLLLCNYSNLKPREKVRVKRLLNGHKTRKTVKGRDYYSNQKGLIEELGGFQMGSGNMCVPQKNVINLEDFLELHHVKYKLVSIWLTDEDIIQITGTRR